MKIIRSIGLIMFVGLILYACESKSPPQIIKVEVTRIVKQTVFVTPEPSPKLEFEISQGISLGVPRTLHSATRLRDGRILLVGGSDGMNNQYSIAEIFNPRTGLLTPAAALHSPRHDHSATLLKDNRVLVVGGYNSQQQWLNDAELYDPETNTWKIVPPIYSHGVQHTATLLLDGRVLVVGGCIGSSICTDRVEIFDPKNDSWSETTNLAAYRASHTAVLLNDGRVLIAGGGGPNGNPTDGDALIYDPITSSWTPTGSMVWHVTQARMVKLNDGRVLVAGGLTISDYPIASSTTQIYDPVSNTWNSAATLLQPRYAFTLETIPDGKVLAIGGAKEYDYPVNYPNSHPWNVTSFNLKVESYDPHSDRWTIVGEMPQPITYGAAALLPDGRIWLTGGGAGQAISPAWAETWKISPICSCSPD
jgi:N-acetylneuraminic acid mutarotase